MHTDPRGKHWTGELLAGHTGLACQARSHHTISYAHIIKMFNGEKVTIYFLKWGDLQQACVKILHLYNFDTSSFRLGDHFLLQKHRDRVR